jgi:hypothetical protein
MRILVESLKRLYESGRVTKEELLDRVASGKISQEEYEYITSQKVVESACFDIIIHFKVLQ